jgi:glycosyltransferase involved in cell wall biosynthesis
MIPVSVIVTTYNEGQNLTRCLSALKGFDEIIIVDSNSADKTKDIAVAHGARIENFTWNKKYPKKRQYCLENIQTKHDYIFFVDGDEEVTPELVVAIRGLNFITAGYFVKGQYIWRGKILKHGLQNNKLVLFDRNKIEFPVVDDLNIEGMGEMEGHYQPVLKSDHHGAKLEQINYALLHFAYEDAEEWLARHRRYAKWEAAMIRRNAYPKDPIWLREKLKFIFRRMPARGIIAFCHSYFWKCGFMDGHAGYEFAKSRAHYYSLVSNSLHHQ